MLGEEQSVHDACIACIHPVFIQDCLACGLRRMSLALYILLLDSCGGRPNQRKE